jgi:hypothetical protein
MLGSGAYNDQRQLDVDNAVKRRFTSFGVGKHVVDVTELRDRQLSIMRTSSTW